MTPEEHFFAKGWVRFDHDPVLSEWVRALQPLAGRIVDDPAQREQWLRCGGTWFAGVNILPNDPDGAVLSEGVPRLAGAPVTFLRAAMGMDDVSWDRAQISVCYPGYPRPWEGESAAAFRFRRDRDAAHVDGLLRSGPDRRRFLGEAHGFILGIPLARTPAEAAPLVVWEGSHEVMRRAFRDRFSGIDPVDWSAEDITETYVAARRSAFETRPRVAVHAAPGESYLVHRLALHGVAPWGEHGGADPRPIAYFRPDSGMTNRDWLEMP